MIGISRGRYLLTLSAAFAVWWTLLAFDPNDRPARALEDALVVVFVVALAASDTIAWLRRRRIRARVAR